MSHATAFLAAFNLLPESDQDQIRSKIIERTHDQKALLEENRKILSDYDSFQQNPMEARS